MLILIVEDEPLCALSTTWELQSAGHEVMGPATTLDEAVELAHAQRPDLALIDIDLVHKGDGVELARRLRDMDVASVFVSAQHALARQNSDLVLGMIGKPYNPAEISRSVEVIGAVMHGERPPPPSIPRSLQLFH